MASCACARAARWAAALRPAALHGWRPRARPPQARASRPGTGARPARTAGAGPRVPGARARAAAGAWARLEEVDGKVAAHVAVGHGGADALVQVRARGQHARHARLEACPQRRQLPLLRLAQVQRLGDLPPRARARVKAAAALAAGRPGRRRTHPSLHAASCQGHGLGGRGVARRALTGAGLATRATAACDRAPAEQGRTCAGPPRAHRVPAGGRAGRVGHRGRRVHHPARHKVLHAVRVGHRRPARARARPWSAAHLVQAGRHCRQGRRLHGRAPAGRHTQSLPAGLADAARRCRPGPGHAHAPRRPRRGTRLGRRPARRTGCAGRAPRAAAAAAAAARRAARPRPRPPPAPAARPACAHTGATSPPARRASSRAPATRSSLDGGS